MTTRTKQTVTVCDDCALVAYDQGAQSWDDQVALMVMMGDMVEDHLCSKTEEPDLDIQCNCGCRNNFEPVVWNE